jgi:hypothetical protein
MKKQMSSTLDPSAHKEEKKITIANMILSLYGVLYILFILDFNTNSNLGPFSIENIVVNLSFIIFLAGYYIVWQHEGIAGMIFIFHWIVMWALDVFISKTSSGSNIVMGLPLFALGVYYLHKNNYPVLKILLTLYGLGYILFISDFNINENTNLFNLNSLFVNLSFILFIAGYYVVWKNERAAGIMFILHWVVMWIMAFVIAETDAGSGVALGLPLFVLGIFFIKTWYKKRKSKMQPF